MLLSHIFSWGSQINDPQTMVKGTEDKTANFLELLSREKSEQIEQSQVVYDCFMQQPGAVHFQFIEMQDDSKFDILVRVIDKINCCIRVVYYRSMLAEMIQLWSGDGFTGEKCEEFLQYFQKNDCMNGVNFVCIESGKGNLGRSLPLHFSNADNVQFVRFFHKKEDGSWKDIVQKNAEGD